MRHLGSKKISNEIMSYNADNLRRSPRKKAKPVQDKGRRKLDFCNERKKPLSGCKVFLDISLKTTVSEITKRIEALGGTVECFLSKDISLVITNQKTTVRPDGFSQMPSPLSLGPSPLQPHFSNKYSAAQSPYSTDSPQHSIETGKRVKPPPVATRGKSLLDKVLVSKRGSGSADTVAKAKNLGAVVFTVEDFMKKYMKKRDSISDKQVLKELKNQPMIQASHSRTVPNVKVYKLKDSFFKIEDQSRAFRPILYEVKAWPKLHFQVQQLHSPFDVIKETKAAEDRKTCEAEMDEEETCSIKAKSDENSDRLDKEDKGESSQKVCRKRASRPGYCDCCTVRYHDLHKHLKGDQHRNFATNNSNFKALDGLISKGTHFDDFLIGLKVNVKKRKPNEKQQSAKPARNDDVTVVDLKRANDTPAHTDVDVVYPKKDTVEHHACSTDNAVHFKTTKKDCSEDVIADVFSASQQKSPYGKRNTRNSRNDLSPVSPCVLSEEKTCKSVKDTSACFKPPSSIKLITSSVSKNQYGNSNSEYVEKIEDSHPEDDDVFSEQILTINASTPNKNKQKHISTCLDGPENEITTSHRQKENENPVEEPNSCEHVINVRKSTQPPKMKNLKSNVKSSPIRRKAGKKKKRRQRFSSSQTSSQAKNQENFEDILREVQQEQHKDMSTTVGHVDKECTDDTMKEKTKDHSKIECQRNLVYQRSVINQHVVLNNEESSVSDCLVSPDRFLIRPKEDKIVDAEISFNATENPLLRTLCENPSRKQSAVKSRQVKDGREQEDMEVSLRQYYGDGYNGFKENILGNQLKVGIDVQLNKPEETVNSVYPLNKKEILLHIDLARFAEDSKKLKTDPATDRYLNENLQTVPGGNVASITPKVEATSTAFLEEVFKQDSEEKCFIGYLDEEDVYCNPQICNSPKHKIKSGEEEILKTLDFSDDDDDDDKKDLISGILPQVELTEYKSSQCAMFSVNYSDTNEVCVPLSKRSTPNNRKNRKKQQRGSPGGDILSKKKKPSTVKRLLTLRNSDKENEIVKPIYTKNKVTHIQSCNESKKSDVADIKKRVVTPVDHERSRKRSRTGSDSDHVILLDNSTRSIQQLSSLYESEIIFEETPLDAVTVFSSKLYDRIKNRARTASKKASESISRSSSCSASPSRVKKKKKKTYECSSSVESLQKNSILDCKQTVPAIDVVNATSGLDVSLNSPRRSPRKRLNVSEGGVKERRMSPRKNVFRYNSTSASCSAYKNIAKRTNTSDRRNSSENGKKSGKSPNGGHVSFERQSKTPFKSPQSREGEVPSLLRTSFEFDDLNVSQEQHETKQAQKKDRKSKQKKERKTNRANLDPFTFDEL
ncbi:uncharacterized protein LOC130621927 [Hydractinia symbiolongicarpus]|uniref:uncharacterized protein LOC130621927 n=1 Tax=Hydractinia symbiolongicarpus TaxID=13093 RepID=UPI00254BCC9B|nr:uncharacterized protein LOC130621927 [Hydractinia symbiolongicarpus]